MKYSRTSFIIIILFLFMLTSCEENNPPETPSPPIGPSTGFQNESLSFSAVTTDPDGDNIS